ncbi:MAG: hypothetical protein IK130_09045 [Oscillospiraceae bacterium]|nr:hypothetical protein [Oscillospiraceae bacterium]
MNQKGTALFLSLCLTAAALKPVSVLAASAEDARHLVYALTAQTALTDADDFNGDGKVNAVDLTLLKRDMLEGGQDTGEQTAQTVTDIAGCTKLTGRTLTKDGITWLVQSGSAVECTVTGTEASVTIAGDSNVHSDEKHRPRYAVYVDNEPVTDVVMGEAEQTVTLFKDSKQRTAAVKIIHLSEANNGAVGVKSFCVTSSAAKPVKPAAKKDLSIEFIGDSITCAYGVEAESQYDGFETGTENFTLSYAYLTAQLLDADYSAVCYSGYGIISGYSGDGKRNEALLVPPVYELVGKPADYAVEWDFAAHPNDVVIVNLGTNDDSFAKNDLDTYGAEFQSEYTAFLKQIRKCNPDAAIICTLGIMGCQELYPYIENAVKDAGDPKISCYECETHNYQRDGIGADWHPSPKTQERNAYLLADKICTAIGRESGKIGLNLAADAEYGMECDAESGANAWPYFAEWNKSLNVNISAKGTAPDSVTAYVRGMALPAGAYELTFTVAAAAGAEIPYALCSGNKTYHSGSFRLSADTDTLTERFTLTEPLSEAELRFLIGELQGSVTFSDVAVCKTA